MTHNKRNNENENKNKIKDVDWTLELSTICVRNDIID